MDSVPDIEISKKLIQLVKTQAFLYDKNLEDYKNESKKNEAWKRIAEALNIRVEDAHSKWSRIRVDFGRHRRKKQSAEACGLKNRDWPLYKLLTWLAPHVKMRATREKKKPEKPVKYEPTGYKPILPRPSWLLNTDNAVKVEVSPSIMLPGSAHEDISESLFVGPNTADPDDEGSLDNVHQSFLGKDMVSGKLSNAEIEEFVQKHELQLTHFKEEMRAALASDAKGDFLYSLDCNVFSWKRKLRSGLVAKLGQIHVKNVSVLETYESILVKALEKLSKVQENAISLGKENCQLKKDRDTALFKIDELATEKERWEKVLYGQFVAVLNTKKERIRLLEEELDLKAARQAEGGNAGDQDKTLEDQDAYAGSTDVDTDVEGDVEGDDAKGADHAERDAATSSTSASAPLRRCRDAFSFDSSPGSPASPLPVLPKRSRVAQKGSGSAAPRNVLKDAMESESDKSQALELDDDMEPLTLQEDTQDLIEDMGHVNSKHADISNTIN